MAMQFEQENNQPGAEETQEGRSAENTAKKFFFGSKDTYLRARSVVLNGIPEVVQAMDQGYIAISQAASLVKLPKDLQLGWVLKPKKERSIFLKQRQLGAKTMEVKKTQKSQPIQAIITSDEESNSIKSLFQLSQYISLNFFLKNLIACCNESDELKSKLASVETLISTELDICRFLQALTQQELIEKNTLKEEKAGAND